MSELCAYDIDGTIRPGSLLADIGKFGVEAGLFEPDLFMDPDYPTWDELPQFFAAMANCSRSDFKELTDRLTESAAEQVFPWANDRMRYQVEQGYHVILVSHGPDFAVKALARGLRAVTHARGSFFRTEGLIFNGYCKTLDKGESITRYLRKHNIPQLSFAAGDTHYDLPMLKRAREAVVVNPDLELEEMAKAKGWEIVSA